MCKENIIVFLLFIFVIYVVVVVEGFVIGVGSFGIEVVVVFFVVVWGGKC